MVWFGALASGVKKFGEEAKAKDVSVAAEAKANAEAFIEKNEEYEDTITMNKNKLRAEAESLQALVGSNVGKIRTVMNAYGNVDVVKKLEQDFLSYQAKNIQERKTFCANVCVCLRFSTRNGRIAKALQKIQRNSS